MQGRTLRSAPVGDDARPAASLVDAMAAVLEGEPDRPILLADKVYVRAAYLVQALAPEALERARAQIQTHSVRSDVLERVQAYTA